VKVSFELLALFRQKAGAGRLEVEVRAEVPFGAAACKAPQPAAGSAPTVLEALRAAEVRLGGQALLDGGRPRQGVLVFLKDAGGATRRVIHPAEERVGPGQAVVLSTAMGGG
jgi:hypothetical protein